jgi:hypothetical protein
MGFNGSLRRNPPPPDWLKKELDKQSGFTKIRGDSKDLASNSTSHSVAETCDIDPSLVEVAPLREKFSFLASPSDRLKQNQLHTQYVVPNNVAPPVLPMWSSSLTSPQMLKRRFVRDSWIAAITQGFLPENDVEQFSRWVIERGGGRGSFLEFAFENNIKLKLRGGKDVRGVFARRDLVAGEVIATIPLRVLKPREEGPAVGEFRLNENTSGCQGSDPLWGLQLNYETLRLFSRSCQGRAFPARDAVKSVVQRQSSYLAPIVHPLMMEQMYSAMFLSCEKEAGQSSPLWPYLRLFPSPKLMDDDYIKEIHAEVMEPGHILDYDDHLYAFISKLKACRRLWVQDVEARPGTPLPPPFEDIWWAFRFIISRQHLLPHMREDTEPVKSECDFREEWQQYDWFHRGINEARLFWLDNVLGVVDQQRLRTNDFDPTTIATVCPLLDMFHHATVNPNVSWSVQRGDGQGTAAEAIPFIRIVASTNIRTGEELLTQFTRCYSIPYTLFRFGFLPLRLREEDMRSDMEACGMKLLKSDAKGYVYDLVDESPDVRVPMIRDSDEKPKGDHSATTSNPRSLDESSSS